MGVANTDFQTVYTTDGNAGPWGFTWRYIESTMVQVYLDGVLQSTSTYQLIKDLVNDGGSITFQPGNVPIAGRQLLIQRLSDTLQQNGLLSNAPLPTETLINMFDKLTIIAQQLSAQVARSLAFPLTTLGFSATLPAPVAGGIPIVNAANNAMKFITPVQAGLALIDNGPGFEPSFGPVTSAAGGNVIGPATGVANNLPAFLDATGKLLKDSGYSVASIIAAAVASVVDKQLWGDGSDGAIVIATNTTETQPRIIRATNVTINAGVTWTVKSGTIIQCLGVFINNGTFVVSPDNLGGKAQVTSYGSFRPPMGRSVWDAYSSLASYTITPNAPGLGGAGGNSCVTANVSTALGMPAMYPYPGITGIGGMAGAQGSQSGTAGDGGNGGGSVGIFAYGGIQNSAACYMQANGTAGGNATGTYPQGGIGGTGGVFELCSVGNIANFGVIEAKGGATGNPASGSSTTRLGGPGGGIVVAQCGLTFTAGVIDLSGGAAATTGPSFTTAPTNGSAGVTYAFTKAPVRSMCFG